MPSTKVRACIRWISLALPFGFLLSCGSSGADKLFSGASSNASGGASSTGGSNAQSGGAFIGSGGADSAGNNGSGMSGGAGRPTVSTGGSASGGTSSGGAASGGTSSGGAVGNGGQAVAKGGQASGGAEPAAGSGGMTAGSGAGGTPVGQGGAVIGGGGGDDSAAGSGGASCMPVDERCDGLDNDCTGTVDQGKTCPSDCDGFVIDGRGYMFCSNETNLAKAEAACEAQGMRLAWIETAEENAALLEALTSLAKGGLLDERPVDARIGATDAEEEGEWNWIGGAPFWSGDADGEAVAGAWANWSSRRPNDNGSIGEDCAAFLIDKPDDGDPGEWNDVPCTEPHPFVCELP